VAPIYGFKAVSLRFFTVYGPRQRPDLAIHSFTRKMVEGRTLTLFGDGTQARDYTYCDDIVAGVLSAIEWTATAPLGVETFNLGGNRSITTEAMVAEIAAALGVKPKIEWAPMQPGDVQQTSADLTKSSAVLGYRPRTAFSEGITRFVHWFREAYGRAD
jgi:UDP-glucuronate 4-epimerase